MDRVMVPISTLNRVAHSLASLYRLIGKVLADGNLESQMRGNGQSEILHLPHPSDIGVDHRLVHD